MGNKENLNRLLALLQADFLLIQRHLRAKTLEEFLSDGENPVFLEKPLKTGTAFWRLILSSLGDEDLIQLLKNIAEQTSVKGMVDANLRWYGLAALKSVDRSRIGRLMGWQSQKVRKHTLGTVLQLIAEMPVVTERNRPQLVSRVCNAVVSLSPMDREVAWDAYYRKAGGRRGKKRGNFGSRVTIANIRQHCKTQKSLKTYTRNSWGAMQGIEDMHRLVSLCEAAFASEEERAFAISIGPSLCLSAPGMSVREWQFVVQILEISLDSVEQYPGFVAWARMQYRSDKETSLYDFVLELATDDFLNLE